ncbi:sigma-70 family RNA polymerase sigma factor [Bacillus spizizenii]|uniref:Sigma-70 family RNA polymerase sigma factor n=1 Tax=Bacillus spizizenii TaxID=96241 RepID=A0A9Q4DLC0_BACSC|nr:sigma-70 family RNA polymerase sigma factor [Bacillus spizizenii]MCY8155203.1 sigma-70 family RNA polymerase sigma factor [Bacillus spizizenii]MCY8313023.1 sigma-70 family RNA polymerase sigma factor [Bacillus spizizenii]MCY8416562.1 sigma-70 family RNA polymerase sigma factor [Bacillus spizizenii]MCY9333637.1 sigma-70 family RNA polymerase sigma factor [Bacillus spizizenii]
MTTATINPNNINEITMDLLNSTYMKKVFNFELFKIKLQDKDDVKQDCIIQILSALKKQKVTPDNLQSFCHTIIRRTVVDYYRKTNRKIEQNSSTVFFCDGFGTEDQQDDSNSANSTFAVSSEEHGYDIFNVKHDFETNRHRFTPTEQNAIEFMLSNHVSMSLSLAEIAEELQINKSHTTRAFKKLRDICGS